jgi:hypothetical protein
MSEVDEPTSSSSSCLTDLEWKKQWSVLLGASLEAWSHHILYVRQVYPRETFAPTRFLGVRCYVSRHPDVVAYIQSYVKVAVPSILSGVTDEVVLCIRDSGPDDDAKPAMMNEKEQYILRFIPPSAATLNRVHAVSRPSLEQVEREMRDLFLSAQHGIPSGRASTSELVSFGLTLHIPEENKGCSELNDAFNRGTWMVRRDDKEDANRPISSKSGRVTRPLHQFSHALVGTIQFASQRNKNLS